MKSDRDLIQDFVSGDRAAFDELVIRHRNRVYATAYRMVGHAEIAEDIAQETFIRAFKGLRSFRRRASFSTWLYRITMNVCYDEFRRRKREAEQNPEAGVAHAEPPAERMEREERRMWLERHVETLPFKQRSALVLRVFEELPFKEIGRALGCSTSSAKVNYRHAILKLKDIAAHSGEEL